MRVGLISDLHLDINRISIEAAVKIQADFLKRQQIDLYLIAGDISNYFDQSLAFVRRLQQAISPRQVRFIAGNHDMLHDRSYAELEAPEDITYLHNQFIDLPGTDWRVIGNNGWYDYQFADNLVGRNFLTWKRAFWVDAAIEQPMSDPERMDRVLEQTTDQLEAAKTAEKRILYMTHFAPRRDFIRYTDDDRFWNMANALMGSPRLGPLLESYGVEYVLFGHLHAHRAPLIRGNTEYDNPALGYRKRQVNEWSQPDFATEWKRRLRVIELK
ncbi:phosphohydrolase [Levilactobacillus senmaizukei DSM 21775 = NBRC 103853]|uniref:Phosphohydrolase n=2 Tax=Levilactobacillus senmaizukei TaxID=431273 RepID=A0A0R2DED8_9LACO|nr:phosphohydrolase [Levilactobacillus senmaizukei DSM 21775 = NBRC 103853]